ALFAGFIGQAIASQQGFAVALAGGAAMLLNNMYLQNMPSPGILGAIIAGFIGGYVVILLQKICRKLPECLDGIKPTGIYP
ncbi:PTS fructose transporter subunit IIC, partial [[Ruminococcus] gnavus]|nr:PTS fructose transporter subunit IIC [Mediterraneibacter gnavus]